MNERGQYGRARRVGADPVETPVATPGEPTREFSAKQIAIASAIVIGGAMLLTHMARSSARERRQRSLEARNIDLLELEGA